MASKRVKRMCKEVDEEGYYRWLKERDLKRTNRLRVFKRETFLKLGKFILHMTGMHCLERKESIYLDGETVDIYQCRDCDYECTEYGLKWEKAKFLLVYLGIVFYAFTPFRTMLPFLTDYTDCLSIFFLLAHLGATLRQIVEGYV